MQNSQKYRKHYDSKELIVMAFCKLSAMDVKEFMGLLPARDVDNVKKRMRTAETDVLLKTSEDVQQVMHVLDIVYQKK